MKPEEIVKALHDEGLRIEHTLTDSGGYIAAKENNTRPGKFRVTLHSGGLTHSFDYSKGIAHRRWKESTNPKRKYCFPGRALWHDGKDFWEGKNKGRLRWGKQVSQLCLQSFRFTPDYQSVNGKNQAVYFFNKYSEPIEPTIDEVLYCLISDAQCTRNGETLNEFARELGYENDVEAAVKAYDECKATELALSRMGIDLDSYWERFFQDY